MGVDLRVGKNDCYTRYKVYPECSKSLNIQERNKHLLGVLHAKDITDYTNSGDVLGNSFQINNVRATLETRDRIKIKVDYLLYAIAEKKWYRVVSVAQNSYNPSQRWSSRPINVTHIQVISESD